MGECLICGDGGTVTAANVHTGHGLSYVAWSQAVVLMDCPGCSK